MTIKDSLAVLCIGLLIGPDPYALAEQQPTPDQQMPAGEPHGQLQPTLSADQLDSLVAPIALYPDPILSQVLVASTYPLEIVEAARWLSLNSSLQGKALVDAAAKQTWDASVQALVVLPDLLKRLNQDITWTADLGNTFLAQQQGVMEAVQRMRQKAQSKGALQSTKEQQVTTTTQGGNTYIEIQPASPQVVYVPLYNPVAVWGPPEYYPYPPIYYPPSTGAIIAAGAISFGVGVAVGAIWSGGWGGWGWGCGWGRNNVTINNNFISSNHFNRVNVGNGNNWVHNPAHRNGVPYNNRNVANQFNGTRNNVTARPTAAQTQQRLNQSNPAQRPNAAQRPANAARPVQGNPGQGGNAFRPSPGNPAQRPSNGAGQGNLKPAAGGDRVGNRSVGAASGGNRGGAAFGGMNQSGSAARMNSNRGFSSGGGSRGGGGRRR
jgi:uncharacterized membrane protein YgcG